MGITYGDYLIDSGCHDITPEQEREIEAREECARRGIDPDIDCADGGVVAWMVVDQELRNRPSRLKATRRAFEIFLNALNYDGEDINSLTVGEIRRALP